MTQLEKAHRLIKRIHSIHQDREERLEKHLGTSRNDCPECEYFKQHGQTWVNYCAEASRLAFRIRAAKSRARLITILVLENVHARG